jgi:hypothetical protein
MSNFDKLFQAHKTIMSLMTLSYDEDGGVSGKVSGNHCRILAISFVLPSGEAPVKRLLKSIQTETRSS